MGNHNSASPALSENLIQYAVPVGDPPFPKESTPIYRSAVFPSGLVTDLPGVKWDSPWDIFQYRLAQPNARTETFIGSRLWRSTKQETDTRSPPGEVEWVTYGEVEEMAINLARGLRHRGLIQTTEYLDEVYEPARSIRPIGIVSKNRVEWFVTEQATCADNITLVPMYESLSSDALLTILDQTRMTCIALSLEAAKPLLKLLHQKEPTMYTHIRLKHLLLFDRPDNSLDSDLLILIDELDMQHHFWKDVMEDGKDLTSLMLQPQKVENVGTLCYTSGTTGACKGVIITAGNFTSMIAAHLRCIMAHPGFRTSAEDVHISYLPLAHVFERLICANVLALGVKLVCYSGDTQKLLDDMKVIKPTVFLSVPRLYMRINDKLFAGLADKSALTRYLFRSALDSKLKNLREKGIYHHRFWDTLVFNKLRQLLGGRVKTMLVGGAPLEAVIQERMSVIFCCPVLHGFGMTEMGAAFICNPGETVAGHIGGVQPSIEFCLRSIPEMNYFADESQQVPCGELLLRGSSVTPGYLQNPEATAEAIDSQGWLYSGDVAVLLPGNCVEIVDRKKNIFKLSQGEYVAPEKIEAIYNRADLVGQIFVHGDSTKPELVAIVVPEEEMAMRWTQTTDRPFSSLASLCLDKDFHEAVKASMASVAQESELKGFEKVKRFTLIPEPFTAENQLLTPTLKLRRHEARLRFVKEIAELYKA